MIKENNTSQINFDKLFLHLSPFIIIIFILFGDDNWEWYAIGLTIAIIIYELLIYKYRDIFGFSALKFLAIPSIAFFSFTVFLAIPGVYICATETHHAVYNFFWALISFYIVYPAGLLFANSFRTIDLIKFKSVKEEGFKKSNIDIKIYFLLKILFAVSVIIVLLYLIRVDRIPLIEMIRDPGAYSKLSILRERSLKLLDASSIELYLFSWLRIIILPFGIIASLFIYLVYKKRQYLILFCLFFIPGIVFNALTLEKSPTAAIFLTIMAVFYMRKNRISPKLFIGSIIFIFSVPMIIMYFIHFTHRNILQIISIAILYRIFVAPSEVLFLYFKIFPDIHDFLDGRTSQIFSWMYSEGIFPVSNYVAQYWWRNLRTTGFANTTFIGNFWADFGWPGIIVSTFLVAIIIHLLYWKLLTIVNYQRNIIFISLSALFLPLFTISFFSVNFTNIFFSHGLILVVILLFYIQYNQKQE